MTNAVISLSQKFRPILLSKYSIKATLPISIWVYLLQMTFPKLISNRQLLATFLPWAKSNLPSSKTKTITFLWLLARSQLRSKNFLIRLSSLGNVLGRTIARINFYRKWTDVSGRWMFKTYKSVTSWKPSRIKTKRLEISKSFQLGINSRTTSTHQPRRLPSCLIVMSFLLSRYKKAKTYATTYQHTATLKTRAK